MYEIRIENIYASVEAVRMRLDADTVDSAILIVTALARGYAWMSRLGVRIVLYRVTGITTREFIYSENVE